MTSGDLIYDQNKIQVKIYGDFKYDVDYRCYNEDYDTETFNKSGSFGLSDIYAESPSDEEVKSELGEEYSLSEDEWLYCANIEYPTIKIYYNYDSNPIIVINDLELDDAWADCGPGGDDYYRRSSWGRDYFSGELSWGDIDIDEDTYELRKTLKDPIGDALASVINYPMAFDYVYHGDRSFSRIDGDELLDDCLEEE